MKMSKIAGLCVAAVMSFSAISAYAVGGAVSTSEFGTLTYDLSKSSNTVKASTSITKYNSSTKVITKLQIQNNATGATLYNVTVTKTGASSAPNVYAINNTAIKLAAFGTHEARGTGSIARYTSATF